MKNLFISLILISTFCTVAYADVAANTLPVFNPNNSQNVVVTSGNKNMNVKILGGKNSVGIANYESFNVGKNAKVNFNFTAQNQTALNTVKATGGISQIYGQLTNSGYSSTGKVILINPNGILFGKGANVNLNSFTASTLDGNYSKNNNWLELSNKSNKKGNITVEGGAKIYGKNGVALIGHNVSLYSGSQISTSENGHAFIITSDNTILGYNKGEIIGAYKKSTDPKNTKSMKIAINGQITAGDIIIINDSTNTAAKIDISNAVLKATKASVDNDGGIVLVADNAINISNSQLISNANIKVEADKNLTVENSEFKTQNNVVKGKYPIGTKFSDNNVEFISYGGKVTLSGNGINSNGNVKLSAAKKVSVSGNDITAKKELNLESTNADVLLTDSKVKANGIAITAKKQVKLTNNHLDGNYRLIDSGNKKIIDVGNSGKLGTIQPTAPTVTPTAPTVTPTAPTVTPTAPGQTTPTAPGPNTPVAPKKA